MHSAYENAVHISWLLFVWFFSWQFWTIHLSLSFGSGSASAHAIKRTKRKKKRVSITRFLLYAEIKRIRTATALSVCSLSAHSRFVLLLCCLSPDFKNSNAHFVEHSRWLGQQAIEQTKGTAQCEKVKLIGCYANAMKFKGPMRCTFCAHSNNHTKKMNEFRIYLWLHLFRHLAYASQHFLNWFHTNSNAQSKWKSDGARVRLLVFVW